MLKWNKKKEELKQEDLTEAERQDAKSDFADLDALTCLLCQRKFKSKADLSRHLELSDLHKVKSSSSASPFYFQKKKKKLSSLFYCIDNFPPTFFFFFYCYRIT